MSRKAIIIGGGLGGLSCAISLKAKGFDVHVFEKNQHFGGKLNVLETKGFQFDLGPSIMSMPHIFEDLFKSVGKNFHDYVKLIRLNLQWRNFFEDQSYIDLFENKDKMRQEILRFSNIKCFHEWESYLTYADQQLQLSEKGYLNKKGLDTLKELLLHYGLYTSIFKIDWIKSLSHKISTTISDDRLRMILEYFVKYVGSSAHHSPAMMSLLTSMQMKYGIWYIEGGLFQLSEALVKLSQEIGIHLKPKSDVAKILFHEKKAIGIELTNGESHLCGVVISNQEFIPTHQNLINNNFTIAKETEKKLIPSCSGLVIHIGTKKQYPQLAHHNFFYSKNQSKHFDDVFNHNKSPEDPTLYVVAPSRSNSNVCPKGHDNLKILPHIPPLSPENQASLDYDKIRDTCFQKLERMGLHHLRKEIIVEETLTPLDIQSMYRSHRGSIYGVACDRRLNQALKGPKQSPDFDSLYFVGGSINPGSGMPMVVLGGQQVAEKIHSSTLNC